MKFTDAFIRNLRPKEKRYDLRESVREGFAIRVAPSGRKTWLYFYDFEGRRRRMSLGVYPQVKLSKARDRHGDALKLLRNGKDPAALEMEKRVESLRSPTVAQLAEEYIEKWAKPRKRSWKEDKRNLDKDVVPVWGKRKARDIKRRDVILLLEKIVERGASRQSNIVFSLLRRMFNFAVERDILEYSPCANVKPLAKDNAKDRCLSEEEIKVFWKNLDASPMTEEVRRALKLILVTAQRPGEVISAHWSEIDGHWWTVPGEKAKNGQVHRVYLSPLAMELIGRKGDGYLFPSPRGGKPIHVNALSHALRRFLKLDEETGNIKLPITHFTPHDLRRTAASHMTGSGISRLVVSKILNHVESGITAVYDRHSYDREKLEAMETWERKLRSLTEGKIAKNVIILPLLK